ncbi:MAG: hypothetical protein RBT62_08995 [Spirochaetia bacterium]|jgi:electron transport complex protein RnfA|nr:hypothetical protein [Spirochaetia bacterium]
MSVLGLAFYFSLGGNILIQWGLVPERRVDEKPSPWFLPSFMVASALAALVDGMVFRHLLTPWGLESLAPVVFAILLFSVFGLLRAVSLSSGRKTTPGYEERASQANLALYAVAMMVGGRFSSVWLLLAGGLSAAFGYVAATRFLDAIMDRLDLEPIPAPFRGAPIRFLSAGLMALAFAGIDASFFIGY